MKDQRLPGNFLSCYMGKGYVLWLMEKYIIEVTIKYSDGGR